MGIDPRWLAGELDRLEALMQQLEEATASLCSWASSPYPMSVSCRDWMCRTRIGAKLIAKDKLTEYAARGMTLDDLKAKLVCRECGKGDAIVSPAPQQRNEGGERTA